MEVPRGDVITSSGTITRVVLEAAAAHPDPGRPAVIDVVGDSAYELSYAELTALVPAAAMGLVRRGVRPRDVGAVCVPGGRDFVLALHALTAAGGVPLVPPPDLGAAELAGLLADSGARVVLAGEPAGAVLEAVDRSYVRQVFGFGDLPGATTFDQLLAPIGDDAAWPSLDPLRDLALVTHDEPAEELTHADRLADLFRLGGLLAAGPSDVVVVPRTCCPAATWAGLIDATLVQGGTFVAIPAGPGDPAEPLRAIESYAATAAVLDPETIRAAAYDHEAGLGPLRVVATAPIAPEVGRTCRLRHGWSIIPMT